jgi:hypothetical protein
LKKNQIYQSTKIITPKQRTKKIPQKKFWGIFAIMKIMERGNFRQKILNTNNPMLIGMERKNEGLFPPEHPLSKFVGLLRRFNLFPAKRHWEDIVDSEKEVELLYNNFEKVLKDNGLEFNENLKVVEIGSGNAKFLEYLRGRGVNAVGVDVNPRGEYKEDQVIALIDNLPFGDESIDVVLSNMVFSPFYKQNQEKMIEDIARVLKTGGVFIAGQATPIEAKNRSLEKSSTKVNGFTYEVFKKS